MPKLDCAFRDSLAAYYKPQNEALVKLIRETRGQAHPAELEFEPFEDPLTSVTCVPDARKALNELIEERRREGNRPLHCG